MDLDNVHFETTNYKLQSEKWPKDGRHILAQFTDQYVIVYQAFNKAIAEYAIEHQRFGGKEYNTNRTSWIKTNFLWMMYRSGWACKVNQEKILAIYVSVEGFEEILKNAYTTGKEKEESISREEVLVRLQWDPDHDPLGQNLSRRAIQLGLKPKMLSCFNDKWILRIRDVTDFVRTQHEFVLNNKLNELLTPKEMVYVPRSEEVVKRTEIDLL